MSADDRLRCVIFDEESQRSIPRSMTDVIFVGLLCTVLVADLGGWWQFATAKPSLRSRQELCSFVGLLANSATLVLPVAYAIAHPNFTWGKVEVTCLALSVLAMVAAAFGMGQVRVFLILAGAASFLVLISIPIGIL
jgi:hypothetical protein